jgi:hypothetical protein
MASHRSADVSASLAAGKSFLEPAINSGQSFECYKSCERSSIAKKGPVKAHSPGTPVEILAALLLVPGGIDSLEASRKVLLKACSLLCDFSKAAEDQENANIDQVPMLDTEIVSTIQQLLDVIVIEGLYPSLNSNVGLQAERRRRSSLYKGVSKALPDLKLLDDIVFKTLLPLVVDAPSTIARLVRDRHLIDMIAAITDVAFSPDRDESSKTDSVEKLNQLLNRYKMISIA